MPTKPLIKFTFIAVLFVAGCGRIFEKQKVERDFLKAHPNYSIISIGEADGNGYSSVVTFFIRYKKPGDEREFWADWAYDTKDGKFELVGEGSENLYSEKPQQ